MYGFHSYQSLSNTCLERPYEIACLIASAVAWRTLHGSIALYGNEWLLDNFKQRGLLDMYTEVHEIEDSGTVMTKRGIDAGVFWSLAKFLAFEKISKPACSVDLDCIVTDNLPFNEDIAVQGLHWDNPYCHFYLDNEQYRHFGLHQLDLNAAPVNCGLLAFNCPKYAKDYIRTLFDFCRRFTEYAKLVNLPCAKIGKQSATIFAEQRLLHSHCRSRGLKLDVLQSVEYSSFKMHNSNVWHLWGEKTQLQQNPEFERAFVNYCKVLLQARNATKEIDIMTKLVSV